MTNGEEDMKAIQIFKTGDASVLELNELPIPTPGHGEALIRLKAAGLNFIDIYYRIGQYPHALPFTPGLEGSGIVEAIGAGVSEVKVGDRVAYTGQMGSYAEYHAVKASQLILLPDALSFEEGAAFPLQGLTAHYLTHEFYRIKPGDYVLIHAAAGGVGRLVVQWVKHLGGKVIGTVSSPEKAQVAKDAGADHIIIYTEEDFVQASQQITEGKGVDYIIDGVGKTTFVKDLEAVRPRGHICLFGSASGRAEPFVPNELQNKSLTVSGGRLFQFIETREELLMRAKEVLDGIQDGWLTLKIDYKFPLEQVAEAQKMLQGRKTTGKVILTF